MCPSSFSFSPSLPFVRRPLHMYSALVVLFSPPVFPRAAFSPRVWFPARSWGKGKWYLHTTPSVSRVEGIVTIENNPLCSLIVPNGSTRQAKAKTNAHSKLFAFLSSLPWEHKD